MSKARVQLYQKAGSITAEDGATKGAQFGRDVYSEDGTVLTLASLRTALQIPPPASGLSASAWSLLLDIPPNVVALEEAVGTGLFAVTGASTGAFRTLQQPAAGIAIANADGVAADPTFTLANDLAAVEGLAGTGIAVRIAADTWAQRQVEVVAGSVAALSVANPAGVAGNIQFTVDQTIVALAAQNWALNALPIGTGVDTVSQVTFAANTFPARASAGNLVAKTISDDALAFLAAANDAAMLAELGGTTVGQALFTAANPSAIRFIRVNADNSVTMRSAADFRSDIGAGTGSGTVTSVAVANATGITWAGSPITTSGTLTPTLSANLQAWHALATSAKQDSGYITASTTYARLHGSNGDASGGCVRVTGTPNFQYTVDGTVVWGVNASGAITVGTIPYGSITSVPTNLASWDSYASSTFFTIVGGGGTSVKWHTNTGPAGGEFRITGTPTFYFTNNGVDLLTVTAAGNMTVAGNVTANGRFSCGSVIATGSDLSSHLALYSTTYGLNVNNSVVNVVAGGNIVASFPTNGNFSATGSVSDAIGNVRDVIGVTRNSTTAFSAADAGKAIVKTTATARTWAVNTGVWYFGMTVTVINDNAAGNVTISQGSGMTLLDGNTTGNFILAPGESRTLYGLSATRVKVL